MHSYIQMQTKQINRRLKRQRNEEDNEKTNEYLYLRVATKASSLTRMWNEDDKDKTAGPSLGIQLFFYLVCSDSSSSSSLLFASSSTLIRNLCSLRWLFYSVHLSRSPLGFL